MGGIMVSRLSLIVRIRRAFVQFNWWRSPVANFCAKRSLLWWVSLNHYFPSVRAFVRPSVRKIITIYRKILGVFTWKNARFTAWSFEHLKFLDFQVSKKRCPKVGLAFTTGRGRDPVLSPFWWTFSKKLKFMFYQKEFNLLGIWRKKSQFKLFQILETPG